MGLEIPPLQIFGIFQRPEKAVRLNRDDISNKITSIIIKHLPPPDSSLRLENDYTDLDNFPKLVRSLIIIRKDNFTKHFMSTPRVGRFQNDCIKLFQALIDKKSEKLSKSTASLDECWLLLTTDRFSTGSFIEPSKDSINHIYKSAFDKIFFFDTLKSIIIELRLIRIKQRD